MTENSIITILSIFMVICAAEYMHDFLSLKFMNYVAFLVVVAASTSAGLQIGTSGF